MTHVLRSAAAAGLFAAGLALSTSASLAQQPQPGRLRGTITAVDGSLVSATLRDGTNIKLHLPEQPRLIAIVKASLGDITPGTFIGIVSYPQSDGSNQASEIHIFPEAMRGSGAGQRPWDLGAGSTMTNATLETKVDAVSGQTLSVKFPGGEAKVVTTPQTAIVRFAPGDKSDLKIGNQFVAMGATKGADGAYEAPGLNIGRDGLKPPM